MKQSNKLNLLLIMLVLVNLTTGYTQRFQPLEPNPQPNQALEAAIIKETNIKPSDTDRYLYFCTDLNQDNNNEVLVYLWGLNFSGTGGATLLIFEQTEQNYHLISTSTLVNMSIIISNTNTNDYHDIIVTVSGGGITEPYFTILKYNNGSYPLNSSTQPQIDIQNIDPKSIIDVEISPQAGFNLMIIED